MPQAKRIIVLIPDGTVDSHGMSINPTGVGFEKIVPVALPHNAFECQIVGAAKLTRVDDVVYADIYFTGGSVDMLAPLTPVAVGVILGYEKSDPGTWRISKCAITQIDLTMNGNADHRIKPLAEQGAFE